MNKKICKPYLKKIIGKRNRDQGKNNKTKIKETENSFVVSLG